MFFSAIQIPMLYFLCMQGLFFFRVYWFCGQCYGSGSAGILIQIVPDPATKTQRQKPKFSMICEVFREKKINFPVSFWISSKTWLVKVSFTKKSKNRVLSLCLRESSLFKNKYLKDPLYWYLACRSWRKFMDPDPQLDPHCDFCLDPDPKN